MNQIHPPKNSVANAIKIYLFPSLVSVLAIMIWRDVTELRSDVKSLLAQSNVDKTRIDNLTNDVKMLEEAVFNKKTRAHSSVYLPQHDPYFKPEEEYDVKKYLKTI
jgi:hypothetical protein